MATTITRTIGPGKNYPSRSAFEAAVPANIVTTDEIWDGEIYAFEDTTAVTVDGITTDATRYVQFRVAAGEGHSGSWGDTKARLQITTEANSYTVSVQYTRILGDQIKVTTNNNAYLRGIQIGVTNVTVKGNIVKESSGITATNRYGINCSGLGYIINNIVYDLATTSCIGIAGSNTGGNTIMYNNTVHNCTIGINSGEYQSVTCMNNIVQDCTTCYSGSYGSASTNNCSDDNTQPGANGRNGEVTFADEVNDNFHLASSDTIALDYGTDLSGDANYPFSDDIDGQTRSGTWDIGADEYIAAGGGAKFPVPHLWWSEA